MSHRRVLIDTGGIYALVTQSDAYHQKAKAFAADLRSEGGDFLLLDFIFAEAMTLLKARLGSFAAIQTGRVLRQSPAYHWLSMGTDGERDTWAMFQRYADKEWSYTDCGLLVASRRLHVPEVFGFDTHLIQMPEISRVP